MAPITTTWVCALIVAAVSVFIKSPTLVEGQPQVQCVFFFGDSQFDNGNNNDLLTTAKVNYMPYGIDFSSGPTGRFANGANIPDFLAEKLGLQNPIPPFVLASGRALLNGVNYASGAAGILGMTGILAGDRFTMNRQLMNHQLTIIRIAALQSNNQSFNLSDYLNRCLYVSNIGSNDYLNNYLVPSYGSMLAYTPQQWADRLIHTYNIQLRGLYTLGARKIAVFGIGLLGCVPQLLASYPRNASGCIDPINRMAQLFNERLKPLIDNLNRNLSNARFTYINITNINVVPVNPALASITVTDAACCQTVTYTGLCIPGSVPCSNRNSYAFWDNYHPTSLVNNATAARAYAAALPADASPVDIHHLVQT